MIRDISRTFKQSAIYGISNILVKVAGFILLPIYTSSLSLDDFGRLVILEVLAQFFIGTFSFQIPSAFLRLGSDAENDSARKKYYFTAIVTLSASVIVFFLLFLPSRMLLSTVLFDSPNYVPHLTYLAISVGAEILGLLPFQLLRLQEKPQSYLAFFSLKLLSLIALVWYFVTYSDGGVLGAIQGIMIANVFFLVLTMLYQIKNSRLHFDRYVAKAMFNYGWPLVFTAVSSVVLVISDRIIIKIYGEFAEVGIYGLAHKIGSLANLLIISSFALGFLPIAFKKLRDKDFPDFFGRTLTYYIGITVCLTLGISLFGKELIMLISSGESDYWLASVLVPFIAFIFVFKALYNYFSYTFLFTKRTKLHATITISGVTVNLLLNFLLIPYFGMYGAIAATGISYLAMSSMSYLLSRELMEIPYDFNRIGMLILSCAVFIAIGLGLNNYGLGLRIILKTFLTVLYFIVLYYGVARRDERIRIKKLTSILKQPNGIVKLIKTISNY